MLIAISYNVIATTITGNDDNIIFMGAHTDTTIDSPGINDNGSGSASLLEVALQLSNFSVQNKVRFAWWSAGEDGQLGSSYYVEHMSPEEIQNIDMYMNFDTIASPNGFISTLQGNGSSVIEHEFRNYFASIGSPVMSSPTEGRSDYVAFQRAGISSSGLFTGANELLSEEESKLFHNGTGLVGKPHDQFYHKPKDTLGNIHYRFLRMNSQAMAHVAGVFARGPAHIDLLPAPESSPSEDAQHIDNTVAGPEVKSEEEGNVEKEDDSASEMALDIWYELGRLAKPGQTVISGLISIFRKIEEQAMKAKNVNVENSQEGD